EELGQRIEGLPGAEELVLRCETDRAYRSKPRTEEIAMTKTKKQPATMGTKKATKPSVETPTPAVEKSTPEELVVFAFRLTRPSRAAGGKRLRGARAGAGRQRR